MLAIHYQIGYPAPAMFVRLTKATRLRAGYFLALVYLLCVLAPAASFAFPGGSKLAPCLTDWEHEFGVVHLHEHYVGAQHLHREGRAHEHADGHALLVKAVIVDSAASVADEIPISADDHPKAAAGPQCCGFACVSALPAAVTEIVAPSPNSVCKAENYPGVAGNAPTRHYRPPIS
jgi:hypothetical protein